VRRILLIGSLVGALAVLSACSGSDGDELSETAAVDLQDRVDVMTIAAETGDVESVQRQLYGLRVAVVKLAEQSEIGEARAERILDALDAVEAAMSDMPTTTTTSTTTTTTTTAPPPPDPGDDDGDDEGDEDEFQDDWERWLADWEEFLEQLDQYGGLGTVEPPGRARGHDDD
jgi:hypothetical protein